MSKATTGIFRGPALQLFVDNPERFSLGGATHGPYRIDSASGIRAGERKTGWTKALPPPPELWALKAIGCLIGLRLGRSGHGLGAIRGGRRASDQSTCPGSGQLALASARRRLSCREWWHPGSPGALLSDGRSIGPGS